MELINSVNTKGFNVNLITSDERHFGNNNIKNEPDRLLGSFADVLKNMFSNANELQHNADNMLYQFVANPDQVDIHDVTIALSKAEDSILFLKSVTEKVISAYRNITTMH